MKSTYLLLFVFFGIFAQDDFSKYNQKIIGIDYNLEMTPIKGGIFLLISGLLLITPGFFTDCIGFLMFLKPVQNFVSQKARNYFQSRTRQ